MDAKTKFEDIIAFIIPILVISLSIFTLFTTQQPDQRVWSLENVVIKQFIFLLIGLVVLGITTQIRIYYSQNTIIQVAMWAISIVVLGGLFVLGGLVNATRRWYIFGPFLFQPAEFIKYVAILWTAFFLSRHDLAIFQKIFASLGGLAVILFLIFLQPDAGTTIMVLATCVLMWGLYMVQFQWGQNTIILGLSIVLSAILAYTVSPLFLALPIIILIIISLRTPSFILLGGGVMLAFVIASASLWGMWHFNILKDYQKERIISFFDQGEETFQILQAKIAIGSGGIWGKGAGQGTQSRLQFLPEFRTDFIFAAFTEERGMVGAFLLIMLYVILLTRMAFVAMQLKDPYEKYIVFGLMVKLWIEIFINIGMNLGLVPTKGVALPFMSYGGSSLISNFLLLGIYQSVYRFQKKNDKMTGSPSFGLV
jgi:rod shape determining protein RodA